MKAESKSRRPLPFFVYGTLLPGQPNAYLWHGCVTKIAQAILTNAQLYDMGYFPMLVDAADSYVNGMVLTIRPADYQAVLARLDHLEGFRPDNPENSAYRRVCRKVRLSNGRWRAAWVYLGQPQHVAGRPIVPQGNWATYISTKNQEIDQWWTGVNSVQHLF